MPRLAGVGDRARSRSSCCSRRCTEPTLKQIRDQAFILLHGFHGRLRSRHDRWRGASHRRLWRRHGLCELMLLEYVLRSVMVCSLLVGAVVAVFVVAVAADDGAAVSVGCCRCRDDRSCCLLFACSFDLEAPAACLTRAIHISTRALMFVRMPTGSPAALRPIASIFTPAAAASLMSWLWKSASAPHPPRRPRGRSPRPPRARRRPSRSYSI